MAEARVIQKDGIVLAILITSTRPSKSVEFVTPKDFALQLGFQSRKKGERVKAHGHVPFKNIRSLEAQEVIMVQEGKMVVGLYHGEKLFEEVVLTKDQSIVLNCAHSIDFLEETILTEVKQGPYRERSNEKRELDVDP